MKIKNLITIALAAIMSVSAMSIPTFAENNTTIDEQLFIDTAKDAIYDYIVERGEEYYTISDVSFNDGDIKYESDNKVFNSFCIPSHITNSPIITPFSSFIP